jgi:hypothetical protein
MTNEPALAFLPFVPREPESNSVPFPQSGPQHVRRAFESKERKTAPAQIFGYVVNIVDLDPA